MALAAKARSNRTSESAVVTNEVPRKLPKIRALSRKLSHSTAPKNRTVELTINAVPEQPANNCAKRKECGSPYGCKKSLLGLAAVGSFSICASLFFSEFRPTEARPSPTNRSASEPRMTADPKTVDVVNNISRRGA